MRNQVKCSFLSVLCHIEHAVFHLVRIVWVGGAVDRIVNRESCAHQGFFDMQTIEFYPGILPGMLFICCIGSYLSGKDQEALPGVDVVSMVIAFGIYGDKSAAAGKDKVEQIMAADMWSKKMKRPGLRIAILIHAQIDKTLVL